MTMTRTRSWACVFRSVWIYFFCVLTMSTWSGASRPALSRWPKMSLVTSSHWIDVWSSVDLSDNVKRYIEHEEIRLKVISSFQNNSDYEKEIPFVERRIKELKIVHEELVKNSSNTEFKATLKKFHPLSIFATVRNFLVNWEDKLANKTVYGKRLREFLVSKVTVPLPTRQDLDKIGTAITVIQATYNLSMADLLQGKVMGHQGELLTRSDCYDIGKTVLKAGLLDTATEWLETAISPIDLNNIDQAKLTFNLSSALTALARIAFRKNDPEKTVRLYEKAVELDPENEGLYQDYLKHRFARNVEPIMELKRDKVEPWRKTFFDTCHNTTNSTWIQEQRKLLKPNVKCRLRRSSSVPYMFYKEEVLSSSPFISLLHDFLSEPEIKTLRNKTLDLLDEQIIPGEVPNTLWQYKGSFFRDDHDDIIQRVSKRAGDVTNMDVVQSNTSYSLGEPLQVIDYGISGLALPHSELNRKYAARYMGIIHGTRVATIQAFLSDAVLGGATMFVEQNVTVIPKKGLAVLWYNFKPNGETEPNLLSSTCPLLVGENIIIEKGIWRLGLDSRAKCGPKKKSTNLSITS